MDTLRNDIAANLRRRLREGFDSVETIHSDEHEGWNDQQPEKVVRQIVAELLPGLIREFQVEQQSWPARTDCDRLDAAFEALNACGIMARHHWTCCGNCGSYAVPDEFDRLDGTWRGVPIIGYAFYHIQDTESAARGEGLWLNYGTCEDCESEAEADVKSVDIGHRVCRILREHGFAPEWTGDLTKRISVPLNWLRRAKPPRFFEGDTSI